MKGTTHIEIFGLRGIPEIKEGDDIAGIFIEALHANNISIRDGDAIVFASKIISKSEGRIVSLSAVNPSEEAFRLAERTGGENRKDPRIVQIIIDESREIVRTGNGHIIVETKHGFICANAGIDESNVPEGYVILLPEDPQRSADVLRAEIERRINRKIAVLIADSHGRAFRDGVVGTCIGVSGISPLLDRRGDADRFGRIARVTKVAVADEICAAANLVMGELSEGIPIAIVRGLNLPHNSGSISEILFSRERDLFR
ncbi:MAG: coenzyme F420-0:L-glutamate ligase [Canidatus Methanoxibalbensis ujae]|nr:coenzyme F420-0:L-glutamate ligase [Candidatus Methanoxibalbensis ujae]MCW7078549.1 coenzyme F420-0:L-glutamate ligase [Candidatus Methanoxibalbensis ujae]